MTPPDRYPGAILRLDGGRNRDGKGWGGYLAPVGGQPWAVVLHTSETPTPPSYVHDFGYGPVSVAPHNDYDPINHRWYQRTLYPYRAGTLVGASSSGGPTNEALAIQVEILCYSAKNIADAYNRLWVGRMDDQAYADLAGWLAWLHRWYGVPLVLNPKHTITGTDHMPFDQWWTHRKEAGWGVCDHARAFNASTHWDCGAMDETRLVAEACEKWLDALGVLQAGRRSWRTRFLKAGLHAAGFWDGPTGTWYGLKLVDAVRAWQASVGRLATGLMVRGDWAELGV